MQAQAFNLSIARYGVWSDGSNGREAITWRSGAPVEYVDVLDADGVARSITLDEAVNGDRLPVGTLADLVVNIGPKQEVVYRRDGSERIIQRDKWRCLSMVAAPAPVTSPAK